MFSKSNLACYICDHVFRNERPVLLVVYEDGDWSFLCGGDDHSGDWCNVVGIGHLVKRDPSLNDCADLPDNFEAERAAPGSAWIRTPINAQTDSSSRN
jgi:hypothetical protein